MTFLDNAGRKGKITDQNIYDYYADIHPRYESQWQDQQNLAGTPLVGGIYDDWMVGRSSNERNSHTRSLYGRTNIDADYPWLSSINDRGVDSRAFGQLVMATAIPSIMGLYASEKKKYRSRRERLERASRYGYQ